MKDEFELKIGPDGTIETIYQEGLETFASDMGAEVVSVCRASNVEWEDKEHHKGWTVRAAHDPELALRVVDAQIVVSREGDVATFMTREAAIKQEVKYFWELLEREGKSNG